MGGDFPTVDTRRLAQTQIVNYLVRIRRSQSKPAIRVLFIPRHEGSAKDQRTTMESSQYPTIQLIVPRYKDIYHPTN